MSHPYHHAVRSAKLFGGKPEDYLAVHDWFDASKAHLPDIRHRALRHHAEGIFLCERVLGVTVTNADGRAVPVRLVGEQHVRDDLGWIPTVKDWLVNLKVEPWMARTPFRPSREGGAGEDPAGEDDPTTEVPGPGDAAPTTPADPLALQTDAHGPSGRGGESERACPHPSGTTTGGRPARSSRSIGRP